MWRSSASSLDNSASSRLGVAVGLLCKWSHKLKAETYKGADQGRAYLVTVPAYLARRAGSGNMVQTAPPRQLFQQKVSI